jgi:Asp-tRNA(Asn)/Glu-tRNA(Gln) amidotransferase A subunit family amidase
MISFSEYSTYDATGLANLIARGEVSASDVLDAAIEAIERLNPELNAIIATFYNRARSVIEKGINRGRPFYGVPFALKDLDTHLAGTPLTNGSRLFENYVSDGTSFLVARYEAAGLVLIGKTNTPELGISSATEPLFTGVTRNPWNVALSPAGSSGGSAAAVAARMLPAAHGNDGGGSIRAPASACGLVGLKPSRGRISHGPFYGQGWGGLCEPHVVCRSIRDTAGLLDISQGYEPGDLYVLPTPLKSFREEIETEPGSLRIALCTRFNDGPTTDPACVRAAENAARLCETLGHRVEIRCPPFSLEQYGRSNVIITAHISEQIKTRTRELGRPLREHDLEPLTWKALKMSENQTSIDYVEAQVAIHGLVRIIGRFFVPYDVLITPTLARPPLPTGTLRDQSDEYLVHRAKVRKFSSFTGIFNATGQPAISLPLGSTEDGLPVGVQFVAKSGREDILLRLASQIERAAPWSSRRPLCAIGNSPP